jgi:hypothetical protein
MHTFILQDWTTIRGATSTSIIQGESGWLDLTAYQDCVFWIDTREITGTTVTMTLQTSPSKDEILFSTMVTAFQLALSTTSATVKPALLASAPTPLARFVRWQLTGPAVTWDATFRILVAANSPGM